MNFVIGHIGKLWKAVGVLGLADRSFQTLRSELTSHESALATWASLGRSEGWSGRGRQQIFLVTLCGRLPTSTDHQVCYADLVHHVLCVSLRPDTAFWAVHPEAFWPSCEPSTVPWPWLVEFRVVPIWKLTSTCPCVLRARHPPQLSRSMQQNRTWRELFGIYSIIIGFYTKKMPSVCSTDVGIIYGIYTIKKNHNEMV